MEKWKYIMISFLIYFFSNYFSFSQANIHSKYWNFIHKQEENNGLKGIFNDLDYMLIWL
jgi:hypothetical protein